MADDTFNGWTNRETWLIHLHITNDPGLYDEARDIARSAASDQDAYMRTAAGDGASDAGKASAAGERLREWLENWLIEENDELGAIDQPRGGLVVDMIRQVMIRADWREIGRALLEE